MVTVVSGEVQPALDPDGKTPGPRLLVACGRPTRCPGLGKEASPTETQQLRCLACAPSLPAGSLTPVSGLREYPGRCSVRRLVTCTKPPGAPACQELPCGLADFSTDLVNRGERWDFRGSAWSDRLGGPGTASSMVGKAKQFTCPAAPVTSEAPAQSPESRSGLTTYRLVTPAVGRIASPRVSATGGCAANHQQHVVRKASRVGALSRCGGPGVVEPEN